MYSFILEATRILNIWSEYIFGKKVYTTDNTPKPTPNPTVSHKQKFPKLIHLPAYKGDAEEQFNLGELFHHFQSGRTERKEENKWER